MLDKAFVVLIQTSFARRVMAYELGIHTYKCLPGLQKKYKTPLTEESKKGFKVLFFLLDSELPTLYKNRVHPQTIIN